MGNEGLKREKQKKRDNLFFTEKKRETNKRQFSRNNIKKKAKKWLKNSEKRQKTGNFEMNRNKRQNK